MKYAEEQHARELHHALATHYDRTAPGTRVTVEGSGVHWACVAERGGRAASVSCFDTRGAENLTAFKADGRAEAWGRTRDAAEVAAAVARWTGGADVTDLHARFAFVDRERRGLTALAESVVRAVPALRSAGCAVKHLGCDLYELWITAADRTCRVYRNGGNADPDAYFHWDGCELFRFRATDPAALAAVLGRWLCDRAAPSAVAAEFPWVVPDPVAAYYEAGRPVEGGFVTSWDAVEEFYRRNEYRHAGEALAMIDRARQNGFDKVLRAGQSMMSLVVSRSRRHGLRDDQPFVSLSFTDRGIDVYDRIDVAEEHTLPWSAFLPGVEALLGRLAAKDVD